MSTKSLPCTLLKVSKELIKAFNFLFLIKAYDFLFFVFQIILFGRYREVHKERVSRILELRKCFHFYAMLVPFINFAHLRLRNILVWILYCNRRCIDFLWSHFESFKFNFLFWDCFFFLFSFLLMLCHSIFTLNKLLTWFNWLSKVLVFQFSR